MKEKENKRDKITIGLDLGEQRHRFCALDGRGEVVEELVTAKEEGRRFET